MEHLALAGRKTALAIPAHEPFDNGREVKQVPAFYLIHILAITLVPVLRHGYFKCAERVKNIFRLASGYYGSYADILASYNRYHNDHISHRQLKDIVVPLSAVDFFSNYTKNDGDLVSCFDSYQDFGKRKN